MITDDPKHPGINQVRPDGQNETYLVLSEAERSKGFVRPYRDAYRHVGVRPKHPPRDLTPDELEKYGVNEWIKYEAYPPGTGAVGRFWTAAQLASGCGTVTTMGRALSETYARDPRFYGSTFCTGCGTHIKIAEFVWTADDQVVGS